MFSLVSTAKYIFILIESEVQAPLTPRNYIYFLFSGIQLDSMQLWCIINAYMH